MRTVHHDQIRTSSESCEYLGVLRCNLLRPTRSIQCCPAVTNSRNCLLDSWTLLLLDMTFCDRIVMSMFALELVHSQIGTNHTMQILYAYGIVGKARWAHLSTSQPHQSWSFRRGLYVVTSAEISPSRRTQRCCMYLLVRISIWNCKIKQSSEAFWRECEMGWSHHTSRRENQQHEYENKTSHVTTHWTHDVVARLNQRHWLWFNVASTSSGQWVDL